MNAPTATFIYARVSTQRQGDRGLSLSEQEDRCARYAQSQNWPAGQVTREVCSGYKSEPRKLKELVAAAPDGSVILITTYDRFSRNVICGVSAIKALAARKVRVLAVSQPSDTLTPSGRYTATILIASGELTSAETGAKVRATFAKRKREGNHIGPAAYGFAIENTGEGEDRKRRKVVNVHEVNVTKLIKLLRDGCSLAKANTMLYKVVAESQRAPLAFDDADGNPISSIDARQLSYDDIAQLLNDYLVEYRHGKEWTGSAVSRVYGNSEREVNGLIAAVSSM